MSNKHGMQMGSSGFGTSHGAGGKPGASSYERGDCGGAYGDYDHGVSDAWVKKRVSSGLKKATLARATTFASKAGSRSTKAGDARGRGRAGGDKGWHTDGSARKNKIAHDTARTAIGKASVGVKYQDIGGKKHASNWDKWRAKKGK